MKKLMIALIAVLVMGAAAPALAVEASADAYLGIYNMYLWRGFDLSHDSDFVVQPGMDVSMNDVGPGSLTFSYWSNYDENTGEMNETDVTVDYSFDLGEYVSLGLGNIFYALDGIDDTNELYLSVGVNVLLNPTLNLYWDYDEAKDDGLFFTFSIGHDFDLASLTEGLSLSLGALASYNDHSDYAVGDYSGFHNAEFSAGLDYAINDQFSIGLANTFSTPLSNDAEDIADIDDEFLIGASLTFAF